MKAIRTIDQLDIHQKRVLIRVDFNVPMKGGKITDDSKIRASLPTIEYSIKQKAKPILMSHLGRPTGASTELSLKPCAEVLSRLLNRPVQFVDDCIGEKAKQAAIALKEGEVLLLENVRFYEGEEDPKKDPTFVDKLAELGECYVNDAFGTAHRAHSSTTLLATHFVDESAMGFLMKKEVEALSKMVSSPEHPFLAIIGGAKISTKLGVLQSLLKTCDTLLLGGAMVYTFMKAKGIPTGNALVEEKMVPKALELLEQVASKGKQLLLSEDMVITDSIEKPTVVKTVLLREGIPDGMTGVDIGEKTVSTWKPLIRSAKMVFWNGPLGVCENALFSKGTKEIASCIAREFPRLFSVVGGGDSLAAIHKLGFDSAFSHLSTGGGASLELIEYGTLPGIEALRI